VFGIGVPELILILVLALIVLGPDKLPQVAKQIAKFAGDLKRASEDFKKQLDVEGLEDIRELKEMANLKNPQTWKKNFDRLVDIDKDAGDLAAHVQGDDVSAGKSDLPGGLGPEWKVAAGPESNVEKAESRVAQPSEETVAPGKDVINPDIDLSALEKATGDTVDQGDKSHDNVPGPDKK